MEACANLSQFQSHSLDIFMLDYVFPPLGFCLYFSHMYLHLLSRVPAQSEATDGWRFGNCRIFVHAQKDSACTQRQCMLI